MTRYTELRHAGYYQDGLTDQERQAIADKVDGATSPRTTAPRGSTTSQTMSGTTKTKESSRTTRSSKTK